MSTADQTKLSPNDVRYPVGLLNLFGSLLPPDIWVIGNLGLLSEKAVGFCGSRKASERGLEVAADCARQLSEAGVIVVSGYAPGVDMASHEAALGDAPSLCYQRASIIFASRKP
jgi:DNA processing protein